MTATPPEDWKPRPCPTCGKPAAYAERPFCSRRCRLLDLGRWFDGGYAIPAVEDDDDADRETLPDGDEDA
ncbi:DNA gyrase inhibitor YacG [Oleispirillum naphthae]|uniref:DNA gyrase inhibitor YacG n=1 Tax=Oleispirillum naphthae TaxID=2838853 RepID=UPI00308239C2